MAGSAVANSGEDIAGRGPPFKPVDGSEKHSAGKVPAEDA
jgi:hypothetical protein